MTSPPAPDPGDDCFLVKYCESGVFTSVFGTSSGQTVPAKYPLQIFVDTDWYIWVSIISYAYDPTAGVSVPHWVWLWKSNAAVSCANINAGGAEGFTIDSGDFTPVCDGLAAGWDTYGSTNRCDGSDTPVLNADAADFSITLFNHLNPCCNTDPDPCNSYPAATCPTPENTCSNCSGGTSPQQFAVTVSGFSNAGCLNCAGLDGTYVLEYWGEGIFGGSQTTCYWYDPTTSAAALDCADYAPLGPFLFNNGMILSIYATGTDYNLTISLPGGTGANFESYSWVNQYATNPTCTTFSSEVVGTHSTLLPGIQCSAPVTVTLTSL